MFFFRDLAVGLVRDLVFGGCSSGFSSRFLTVFLVLRTFAEFLLRAF